MELEDFINEEEINQVQEEFLNNLLEDFPDDIVHYLNIYMNEELNYELYQDLNGNLVKRDFDGPKEFIKDYFYFDSIEDKNRMEQFIKLYDPEIIDFFKSEIEYKIQNIFKELVLNDDKDKLILYRGMALTEEEIRNIDLENLGIHWTKDKNVSYDFAYNYRYQNSFIITAEVDPNIIDWKTTILMNLSGDLGATEKEFRLFEDNQKVDIIKIEINDEDRTHDLNKEISLELIS